MQPTLSTLLLVAALAGCRGPSASHVNPSAGDPAVPAVDDAAVPDRGAGDLLPGWRSETIALPPGFAPTLPAGTETLRFAPDAFVEGSETLWTYCFAARAEGDWTGPERLSEFFRTYFDGLSAAVSAGKGVTELPPTRARFRVEDGGTAVGGARVFDGFVRLEPFRLLLRVDADFDGESTELRVRASPRPFGDPIWSVLDAEARRIEL
ncbi:MAG: hypothetical protein AAFU73_10910 [Planctomycetota bacterium]